MQNLKSKILNKIKLFTKNKYNYFYLFNFYK